MNQYINHLTMTSWDETEQFELTVSLDLDSYDDGGATATVNGQRVDVMPRGVCVHGVFVAGMDRDIPCGACEMGEDPWTASDLLRAIKRPQERLQGLLDALEEYEVAVEHVGSIMFPSERRPFDSAYAWIGPLIKGLKARGHWDAWCDDPRCSNLDQVQNWIQSIDGYGRQLERAAAVSADPSVDFESVLYHAVEKTLKQADEAGLLVEREHDPYPHGTDCMRCDGYGITPMGGCAECDGTGAASYRY